MPTLTLGIALSTAFATPLVHDGPAEPALEAASTRTSEASWEPRPFGPFLEGGPVALGGSEVVASCTPGSDEAPPVTDALRAFKGAVLYADPDLKERQLAVLAATACEGADADVLGQLGFLAGIAAFEAGDTDRAASWFRDARSWDPELVWNPDFNQEIRLVFEGAVPSGEAFSLDVTPAVDLTIDGRTTTEVRPGLHLVRTAGRGLWVRTSSHPETLIWPAAVGAVQPDVLGTLDASEGRTTVTRLLSLGLGEGTRVGVFGNDVVWTGTTGRTDWRAFRPDPPAPDPTTVPVPTGRSGARSPIGPILLTGLGVVVAGTGAALSTDAFHRDYADPDAWKSGRSRYWAGWGLVSGGAVLGTAGLTWAVVR